MPCSQSCLQRAKVRWLQVISPPPPPPRFFGEAVLQIARFVRFLYH